MSDNSRQDDPSEVKLREGLIESVREIINYINTHTGNGMIERTGKSIHTLFLLFLDRPTLGLIEHSSSWSMEVGLNQRITNYLQFPSILFVELGDDINNSY